MDIKNNKSFLNEVVTVLKNIENTVPANRTAFKNGFSFTNLSFEEQLSIWDYIWNNGEDMRTKLQAYLFVEKHIVNPKLHLVIWEKVMPWQQKVTEWSMCDALAKIYTKIVETHTEIVYEQLKEWNHSQNLFNRRQSVVSLLYFSRTKKNYLPFSKIIIFVFPLLADKEYYVQKGVGWCLKELINVYKEETMDFIKKNINIISPIAFTIAIEKINSDEKEFLKQIRNWRKQ